MNKESRLYVAGHKGLIGSAILRNLSQRGYENIVTRPRSELDLTNQQQVEEFFERESIEVVFLAAAKVGGINANRTLPAEFIEENLKVQTNTIDSAYRNGVAKLVFLGSSCIYPRLAPQPIKEEYLLTGELESTNEAYAIAKIAGIKMCQAYRAQYGFNAISVMPTNTFGPYDNYHPENSHVVAALIKKFHDAKLNDQAKVVIWGTGTPLREIMYVDDLADAIVHLAENYDEGEIVNIGNGREMSIAHLAELIAEVSGYKGNIEFDSSMPDGTPRKLLDVTRLHDLGWQRETDVKEALTVSYQWFADNQSSYRR